MLERHVENEEGEVSSEGIAENGGEENDEETPVKHAATIVIADYIIQLPQKYFKGPQILN